MSIGHRSDILIGRLHVTRLTLRMRSIPEFCGAVFGEIKATSDAAFHRLLTHFMDFYAEHLFNQHWGESVRFGADNVLGLHLVFHDLNQEQAEATLKPLLDFVAASPADYAGGDNVQIMAVPARHWWDAEFLSKKAPSLLIRDPRAGAPEGNVWYAGDDGQVGFFLHGYESAWLPAELLGADRRDRFNDTLFAATRQWPVALHFNKGLGGAPAEELAAARDTAINPAVTEAFALAIIAHGGPPAYPGMPGLGPDLALARRNAAAIGRAIGILRELIPDAGSYVSEAAYADQDWQRRSFGSNYPRLLEVKRKYDPDGLFVTHHGVGSEEWSPDGFVRL